MNYPQTLQPTYIEQIGGWEIAKATPVFREWDGDPVEVDDPRKPLINLDSEAVYTEIAILRLFEAAGWQGAWLDTYYRRYRAAIHEDVVLPSDKEALLKSISPRQAGRFDVFCWKDDTMLFAESKWRDHDSINANQEQWLAAAIAYGLPLESFLIVEWSLEVVDGR